MQCCYLERRTLLSPPNTSTGEHRFCFGPAIPFLLELLVITLCSSTVAYWTPSDLEVGWEGSSFGVISFYLFILSMGFSRQEYWSGAAISFFSGLCFVRTLHYDLTILVALHSMAHSFTELHKNLYQARSVIHEGDTIDTFPKMDRVTNCT